MKRIQLLILAGCLMPAVTAFGQAPVPPQPAPAPVIQQAACQHCQAGQLRGLFSGMYQPAQNQSYYSSYSVAGGGTCPPAGYGTCPPGGNVMVGGGYTYPRHNISSAYNVPRNLVYPQQGSTGGVVVYPYYTHKGPSDFFRK